jgi:hypothetical protein
LLRESVRAAGINASLLPEPTSTRNTLRPAVVVVGKTRLLLSAVQLMRLPIGGNRPISRSWPLERSRTITIESGGVS